MEQMLIQLMPLFLIFAIFYFLLIRPQQRRAKEHREMVAAVQRGDKIVSSGGVRGKVVKVIGDTDVDVLYTKRGVWYAVKSDFDKGRFPTKKEAIEWLKS